MDKRLLDIPICCPVTKLPLQLLGSEQLATLNAALSAGRVPNHAAEPLSEALVTRNGQLVYPIREGVPVLLEEASIDWQQLGL